jgi:hypothetical protein
MFTTEQTVFEIMQYAFGQHNDVTFIRAIVERNSIFLLIQY